MLRKVLFCTQAVLVVVGFGCTHHQLKWSTTETARTLTDMQYGQVLDNIAMFKYNEYAIPYFAVVGGGNVQVQDNGGLTGTLKWPGASKADRTLAVSTNRTVSGKWDVAPVTDPTRLEKMQVLYQFVVDPRGKGKAAEDRSKKLESAWTKVLKSLRYTPKDRSKYTDLVKCWDPFESRGKRKNKAKACYVGKYNIMRSYAITPQDFEALSALTLVVLEIVTEDPTPRTPMCCPEANLIDPDGVMTVTKEEQAVAEAEKRFLEATEETSAAAKKKLKEAEETLEKAAEKEMISARQRKRRKDFYSPQRSGLLVP